jgi:hypothetical protein
MHAPGVMEITARVLRVEFRLDEPRLPKGGD